MSESTIWHTERESEGKTTEQLAERIAVIRALPEWQGYEFDDIRVRHKRQTEISTLERIIAERSESRLAAEQVAEEGR